MAHALLSASGAEKWFNCPPSARLEESMPDSTSSYAEEGTLAHSIAELIISYNLNKYTKTVFNKKLTEYKKNPLYNQEMLDYVSDFATYVADLYREAKKKTSDAVCKTEQRLDFSGYVPDGFGTGDVIIISDGTMRVIDFKYGAGVPVRAENNKQMMLYALGALNDYDLLYDINDVTMTIYQPRLENISEFSISVEALLNWAETELKPKADLAFKGEGEFNPGGHCRFCKAKATCRARAEEQLSLASYEFAPPSLLTDDEIPTILRMAEQLQSWVSDIKEYAYNEALNGKKWAGFKLVEGRSNRTYTDEDDVAGALHNSGFSDDQIYEMRLLGITKIEKLLGKKQFDTVLSGLIYKPQGKPTLVPDSDNRPEWNSAQNDFNDDFKGE